MDPSALERSINSLDTSLGHWGVFIVVMTALVGVGLILECLYEIPAAIKERKEEKNWKPLLIITGVVLITVGVLGEFVGEYEAGDKESQLRKANDQIEYALAQEVADAQTNAKGAEDAAKRARDEADQAAGIAKSAKAGALDAQRQVASVQSEAASLKAVLDTEKEDLRKIRTARNIQDMGMGFLPKLRPFSGTKYMFWTVAQDSDSLRIAIILNDLLKTAGWIKVPLPQQKEYDPSALNIFRVSNPEEYIPPERFSEGIRIFINSPVVIKGEMRSLASLWKVWGDNPPSSAKPADALASDLNKRLFPPEHTTWGGVAEEEKALGYRPIQVYVVNGNATDIVGISVGPKPL